MLESSNLNSHDVAIDDPSVATFLARNDKNLTQSKPAEISDEALMMVLCQRQYASF